VASGVHKPNRIVRSDGIEIGGGDVTVFCEFALVPARTRDPFARFDESDLGFYAGDNFCNRYGIRELDAVEFFDPSVSDVCVCVDQAWCGSTTVEIDDTNAVNIAGEIQHLSVGPNFHDHAVAHSNGLGYRIVRIHGKDVTVN